MTIKLFIKNVHDRIFGSTTTIRKKHLLNFLPDDAIVFEAGAHIGRDTVELAQLFKRGCVYAFEPIPDLYTQLTHNTKDFKNIRCFLLAIGDRTGIQQMVVSSGASDASSSLLEPNEHMDVYPEVLFDKHTEVNVTTIDDWIISNHISRLDFMWLDLQGMELLALSHGEQTLKMVKAVYMEVSRKELYHGQGTYEKTIERMKEYGFSVGKEFFGDELEGNILFVKRSL